MTITEMINPEVSLPNEAQPEKIVIDDIAGVAEALTLRNADRGNSPEVTVINDRAHLGEVIVYSDQRNNEVDEEAPEYSEDSETLEFHPHVSNHASEEPGDTGFLSGSKAEGRGAGN